MTNPKDSVAVLDFINGNDHFFLNLSMPASKAILDPARNISMRSSIVIAMARNGTLLRFKLAEQEGMVYVLPLLLMHSIFPGFSKEDADPDIGDSSITETGGLGGFCSCCSCYSSICRRNCPRSNVLHPVYV